MSSWMFNRDTVYYNFIGGVAHEDDGVWSKEVWDAAWREQQKNIDLLHARVKELEEECAWLNSVGRDK
jgi:hypothetical protein